MAILDEAKSSRMRGVGGFEIAVIERRDFRQTVD